MPMIRNQNMSDVSVDIPLSMLTVTVGNEQRHEADAQRIPLKKYIEQLGRFNHMTYNDASDGLLLPRDVVVLASAQACLLPLECNQGAETEFVPELYSYQSDEGSPAVLVIVSSTYGTSAQITRPGAQPLYFNRGGEATKYVAKDIVHAGVGAAGLSQNDQMQFACIQMVEGSCRTCR